MKTLKDHVILYDSDCPLCELYTSGFVNTGMLDKQGREAFNSADEQYFDLVDRGRACDEIALIDRKDQRVYYGVDSLLRIIGYSFPVAEKIFQWRPLRWMTEKIYAFVSNNRKVIIPATNSANSCTPSLHTGYRTLYLVFAWIVTAVVLHRFSVLCYPVVPTANLAREFMICGGQLIFQALVIGLIGEKNKTWDYLGNLMTISLAGSLMLLPALAVQSLIDSHYVFVGWFGIVVTIMLSEHMGRIKILKISPLLTFSWVMYRVLVLFVTGIL